MHTLATPPPSTITHDAHDLVILCDKSLSMRDVGPTTGRSRISILNETLRAILPQLRSPMLLEFAREVQSVQRRDEWLEIRADGDGTCIATALRTARLLNPCRVILITDGEPTDDPAESLILAGTTCCTASSFSSPHPSPPESRHTCRKSLSTLHSPLCPLPHGPHHPHSRSPRRPRTLHV